MRDGVLGLVTARGGSKGLPNKHLLPLGGRPLIEWTIRAALESGVFSRVVVSTDSELIGAQARRCGAEVPFKRPDALATDTARHIDVVVHALDWLELTDGYRPERFMLLQPTSPLRTSHDIVQADTLMFDPAVPAVLGVVASADHPWLAWQMSAGGALAPLMEGTRTRDLRRQDLPPSFHANGAIFEVKADVFRQEHTFQPTGTVAFVMPPERSIDIDTAFDFSMAEALVAAQGSRR